MIHLLIHLPALLALALLACPAQAQTISGKARSIDGDTIEVAGTCIRLEGIDAPERGTSARTGSGSPTTVGAPPSAP